jgi:hypothetical protein
MKIKNWETHEIETWSFLKFCLAVREAYGIGALLNSLSFAMVYLILRAEPIEMNQEHGEELLGYICESSA